MCMNKITSVSAKFRKNIILLFGVCLSLYFSYNLAYGARSYLHMRNVQDERSVIEKDYSEIRKKRDQLEGRVVMMRPETASRDMLEERARDVLGYQDKSEVVIIGN